jgi:HPt (histidine-containing phosphotransfer) domain-containing protein
MASLKDLQQLTQELEDLVGQLNSELENGEVNFDKLVSITDSLSEQADGLAETFNSVNDALMQRLEGAKEAVSGASSSEGSKSSAKAGSRS